MAINSLIAFASASLCGVLAIYVLRAHRMSFASCAFSLAMAALAVEELFVGLSGQSELPSELLSWQRARINAMAFVPGSWLLFSLGYSRPNYREFIGRWKWIIIAAFGMPIALALVFNPKVFSGIPRLHGDIGWNLGVGGPGQLFYVSAIVVFTLVLANLERTLRASSGAKRWQIKFLILGLGGYMAFRIYDATQTLLFSSLNSTLELTNSATLLVGCIFVILSLARAQHFEVDVYLSNTFVYRSITILVIGIYLLVVGVLSSLLLYFTGDQFLTILPFVVFLAVTALGTMLFSAKARQLAIALINRHLRRPAHDYRQVWRDFSERTAEITDVRRLCTGVADLISEAFGVPAVTVWLFSSESSQVVLGGSTSFSIAQSENLKIFEQGTATMTRILAGRKMPADFGGSEANLRANIERDYPNYFRQAQVRYAVPLHAHQRVLGVLTMSDCLSKQALSNQDLELLKTIAHQAANALLNRKLSEELMEAKELEAFQTMSAFFVHDLKNLAGGLSLMSRNLLTHLDNEEFRRDAVTMLSQSVDKLRELCERMSQWNTDGQHRRIQVDLNELVRATVGGFNGALKASLVMELEALPELYVDPEQVQKVLINLILNADEAAAAGGEIRVATACGNGCVHLTVTDNGCGMSPDFVDRRLFRPFQTSKKHGLGIGLFHCKHIIQAHSGRIEVESEEGKGSIFRVVLPVESADPSRSTNASPARRVDCRTLADDRRRWAAESVTQLWSAVVTKTR
ncbi:MAG TPA: XrtA/PEP-CTERM system histidine kinase PrsK [Candidatus Binatia bacterium]|nr:XrtA/PEP-CTERM system histidine kinase PrsK [Candidatus Binatia bacterium]